jgi:O-acetyl-ADP-ribose deacetylase (regulator of RNase III)
MTDAPCVPPRRAYRVVVGDLTKVPASYVAHQCNCTSLWAKGVAAAVFEAWPHADAYRGRVAPSKPGTVGVVPPRARAPGVLNLFAQVNPGPPRGVPDDGPADRRRYFAQCLAKIKTLVATGALGACPGGIAFPWNIGCGLAGGEWARYEDMLAGFAATAKVVVLLVKLPLPGPPSLPSVSLFLIAEEEERGGGGGGGGGADEILLRRPASHLGPMDRFVAPAPAPPGK